MHLVSRLRSVSAMMIVLLSLLAGLGVASANAADAPILTGGGGGSNPPRGGAKSRLFPQQCIKYSTSLAIASDNSIAVKHRNSKPKCSLIADGQYRQRRISSGQINRRNE